MIVSGDRPQAAELLGPSILYIQREMLRQAGRRNGDGEMEAMDIGTGSRS